MGGVVSYGSGIPVIRRGSGRGGKVRQGESMGSHVSKNTLWRADEPQSLPGEPSAVAWRACAAWKSPRMGGAVRSTTLAHTTRSRTLEPVHRGLQNHTRR